MAWAQKQENYDDFSHSLQIHMIKAYKRIEWRKRLQATTEKKDEKMTSSTTKANGKRMRKRKKAACREINIFIVICVYIVIAIAYRF